MKALAGWTAVLMLAGIPAASAALDGPDTDPVVLSFPVTPDAVGSIGAQDVLPRLASPVTPDAVGSIGAQDVGR